MKHASLALALALAGCTTDPADGMVDDEDHDIAIDGETVGATEVGVAAATAKQFYIDPVHGSNAGNGTAARPWHTLAEVVAAGLIQTHDKSGAVVHAGSPITEGSTVWLLSGYHGDVAIAKAYNTATITIAAANGATPKLRRLAVSNASKWTFRGLSVSQSYAKGALGIDQFMVQADGGTSDITFDALDVFTERDAHPWDAATWNLAPQGVAVYGTASTLKNTTIHNVRFGLVGGGSHNLIDHNTVDGFAVDGMRGLGEFSTFSYNTVKNVSCVNDEHQDGFQSWSKGTDGVVGHGVIHGNVLRGNRIFQTTDRTLYYSTHDCAMHGIGGWDGFFDGWIVENNVVVVDHWHGIGFLGMSNSRIENNTVVDLLASGPGPSWILVGKHKDGRSSENVTVRNNITQWGINIEEGQKTSVTEDHNLKVATPATFFVDVAAFNFHLLPGSAAIDKGTSTNAPARDADGTPRPQGHGIDQGAYEYHL